MPVEKKWQRSAAAGAESDHLRREVVEAVLTRADALDLSRESLGQRACLGGSYVHQMAAGQLNPTLRSIGRLVAVLDGLEGADARTITIVRELGETVQDAQAWVRAARERIRRV